VYSQEKRLRIPRAQHGSHRDTSDLFSIPPLPLLFVPILINMAREKGVSAYIDEGLNRWPAVHRLDAAHLFRLAFEKGDASAYYHGVAEEGVPFRQIAEVIGRLLNVPVVGKASDEAAAYFTWFTHFAALDVPASSKQTQEKLGWHPNSTWINRRH